MKPHLDIECGDLVSVVSGKNRGRTGVVIGIGYKESYNDTLVYMLLDESKKESFSAIGAVLKFVTPCYLSQGSKL